MTDGASPAPHADPALARDCTHCRGWGTIITDLGRHELCPHCQHVPVSRPSDASPQGGARRASPAGPVSRT